MTYLDCWQPVAAALFAQALAGQPGFEDAPPKPMPNGGFGWVYSLEGGAEGRFSVLLDAAVLEAPLLGEGVDQREAWNELLREVAEAACGDLLARTGEAVRIAGVEETTGLPNVTRAFLLQAGEKAFPVLVRDELRQGPEIRQQAIGEQATGKQGTGRRETETQGSESQRIRERGSGENGRQEALPQFPGAERGRELLVDVELETTLRFGCRELPLSELLELGPGDVVPLDRNVSDPVDLVVGDKIIARGEVVMVNGNFGLRVTEVAEPRKRLESIRCLF
jgi:flagellar motor switch protein FliN/FliY